MHDEIFMKIFFYIPEKALNDATQYYTDLIKQALMLKGIEVVYAEGLDFDFNAKSDHIFVIRTRDFVNAYKKFRTKRMFQWFQGVSPEEYLMIESYSLKSKIIYPLFNALEKFVLKRAEFAFFVSQSMLEHYEDKYRLRVKDYSIIPCYNKQLTKSYFDASLKEPASFVYAGTLFAWQCFEKTVALYKEIESRLPEATFTVLTKEKQAATAILEQYQVKNYKILYVPLQELDAELSKYQYGFLIREPHIINKVSTPTKMNSYLSVALMPVYTAVIDSFEQHLNLGDYGFKVNLNVSLDQVADQFVKRHQKSIDYPAFFEVAQDNFKGYYDDVYNISKIQSDLIRKLIPI